MYHISKLDSLDYVHKLDWENWQLFPFYEGEGIGQVEISRNGVVVGTFSVEEAFRKFKIDGRVITGEKDWKVYMTLDKYDFQFRKYIESIKLTARKKAVRKDVMYLYLDAETGSPMALGEGNMDDEALSIMQYFLYNPPESDFVKIPVRCNDVKGFLEVKFVDYNKAMRFLTKGRTLNVLH